MLVKSDHFDDAEEVRIIRCSIASNENSESDATPEVLDMRSLSNCLVILNGFLCITGEVCCTCGNSRCFIGNNKCLTHKNKSSIPSGSLFLPVRRGQNVLATYPDNSSPISYVESVPSALSSGKYTGKYQKGLYHGYGAYVWTRGDKYQGEWQEGKPHGKGTITFSSGSTYCGEFLCGKRHGQGQHKAQHGEYQGEWRNDRMHGSGTLRRNDGSTLCGEWLEGQFAAVLPRGGDTQQPKCNAQTGDAQQQPSEAQQSSDAQQGPTTVSALPGQECCPAALPELTTVSPPSAHEKPTPEAWAEAGEQWRFLYVVCYVGDAMADLCAIDRLLAMLPAVGPARDALLLQRRKIAAVRERRRPTAGPIASAIAGPSVEEQALALVSSVPRALLPVLKNLQVGEGLRAQGQWRQARAHFVAAIDWLVTRRPAEEEEEEGVAWQRLLALGGLGRAACEVEGVHRSACALREARAELAFCAGFLDPNVVPAHLLEEVMGDLDDLILCLPHDDGGYPHNRAGGAQHNRQAARSGKTSWARAAAESEDGEESEEGDGEEGQEDRKRVRQELAELGVVGDPEECPVCLGDMAGLGDLVKALAVLPCRHAMCRGCQTEMEAAGDQICPVCRRAYEPGAPPPPPLPFSSKAVAASGSGRLGSKSGRERGRRKFRELAAGHKAALAEAIRRVRDAVEADKAAVSAVLPLLGAEHDCKARMARGAAAAATCSGGLLGEGPRAVGVLRAVANPTLRGPAYYGPPLLAGGGGVAGTTCDESQRSVINGLRLELEGVQGPPGSGKSQTIVCTIASRLPHDGVVLVACMQNKAVDALAAKLVRCGDELGGGFVVLGAATNEKLGPIASEHTLWAQVERDPQVAYWAQELANLGARRQEQKRALAASSKDEQQEAKKLYMKLKRTTWKRYTDAEQSVRLHLMSRVRVLLGTVGASRNLYFKWHHPWHYAQPESKWIHTVILDEAGAVPEHRLPVLVALRPARLLLMGDHKQLPPFTAVPSVSRLAGPLPRSLLQRVAEAVEEAGGGALAMLRTQYRMHPAVARYISSSFYGGLLVTDPGVAARRMAPAMLSWPGSELASAGVQWLDYRAKEGTSGEQKSGSSFLNPTEACVPPPAVLDSARLWLPVPMLSLLQLLHAFTVAITCCMCCACQQLCFNH